MSVLACHLLPLGPKWMRLNEMAGPFGMALFFTLSGFLITSTLHRRPDVRAFFIRRFCRILPLAFLYIVVTMAMLGKGPSFWLAHLAFTINYQHQYITELTGHLWSLCVEMQFYVLAGLIVLVAGRRALWVLPVLALAVTGLRVYTGTHISIVTHLRADEILAGAMLALVHLTPGLNRVRLIIGRMPVLLFLAVFVLACHPSSGAMNYARPYLAAALVGCSLWSTTCLSQVLITRPLKYAADTSYALYVVHPLAAYGWLAGGSIWTKYLLKRPITFAITFIAAHCSSFYYEKRWIALGKRWSK